METLWNLFRKKGRDFPYFSPMQMMQGLTKWISQLLTSHLFQAKRIPLPRSF
jgi:hypothetical protein